MEKDWKQKAVDFFNSNQFLPVVILTVLIGALTYGYWNTLHRAAVSWNNPRYSHGYLIPFFTLFLLWLRREPFGSVTQSTRWAGVGIVCFGLLIRVGASYVAINYFTMCSYVVCLGGLFVMAGGWTTLRWAGPPVGFLIFMFPLGMAFNRMLLEPLQKVATIGSTYCLQTMGMVAIREGNRIDLEGVQLGVVDACSGLRMLTIFMALAVAITFVTTRPWWERIVIVVSAIPIAVAVNIARISITGVLYSLHVDPQISEWVFHNGAGYLMMPLALGLLYLEVQVLSRLFIDEEETPSAMGLGRVATR